MTRAYRKPGIVSLLVLLFCYAFPAYCQNANNIHNLLYEHTPKISSPNAAALEKYVEFPTATYTGVPEISIPLFETGIKGVKLPVSLSYHAGGIKVDDMSSDIGAGWSLIAGGTISILANGMLDEISGFPTAVSPTDYNKIKTGILQSTYGGAVFCEGLVVRDPLNPSLYGAFSGGDIVMLGGVMMETYDTEPDIYSFQFPGKSGRFVADENGIFRTLPYSELKIERTFSNGFPAGYIIRDESGNVFEYKVREGSEELRTSVPATAAPSQKTTRTYYLSKIMNPHGETIDFYYSSHYYTYPLQKTFSRSKTTSSICSQLNSYGQYFSYSFTEGSMSVVGQRLDSIKTTNGDMVILGYSSNDRTDLPATKSLDKIEYWQHLVERKKIKTFILAHGYSGGRLMLNSVQEEGKPATVFTYNGTCPERLSFSQDHYGYYNDKGNSTLLPKDDFMGFTDGADRSVDTQAVKAGILTRITHPTGGYTEYLYESNNFYLPITTTTYVEKAGGTGGYPDQTISDTFTIPANAGNINIYHENSYDGTTIHNDYCFIHLYGPNNYYRVFYGNSNPPFLPLDLQPGQYILSVETVGSSYYGVGVVRWTEPVPVPPHNEYGGGVRIKEIRKVDEAGATVMKRKYEYLQPGTAMSSGLSTNIPTYITHADQVSKIPPVTSGVCTTVECFLRVQSAASNAPLGFANGSPVLYSDVITWIEDKTQNGYSHYKFNVADYGFNMSAPSFPYAPRIPYDWTNGNLLEQHDYVYHNGQFIKVKELKNQYNYNEFNPYTDTSKMFVAYGLKIGLASAPAVCNTFCEEVSISFGLHPYQYYSSWQKLNKTEETVYDITATRSITTTTEYFHDNPSSIQATRIESKNSKGETVIQRFKFPRDYAPYGFAQYLLSQNAVAIPIEKYRTIKNSLNNEAVTQGQITTYKSASVLPDKLYSLEAATLVNTGSFTVSTMNSSGQLIMDAHYKETISFNAYSSNGNITELQKKDDIVHSYIWDYALSKPIAEVKGAPHNQIAYTSFEADGWGGWTMNSGSTNTNGGITGKKSISGGVSKTVPQGNYMVSVWSTGNTWINGQLQTQTPVKVLGVWRCHETLLSNVSSVNVTGNNIDEVRLYPQQAEMITYTYEPLIGITSKADEKNGITYYEYDGLNRLLRIRDEDGNILKQFDYQYQKVEHANPVWQATGVTRCKPCPANEAYTTNIRQNEEKDTNPNSPTYNQARWIDAGTSGNCVILPDWQNTATPVRCKLLNGQNTGEQEQEQRDMNPCSSTYNTIRWIVSGTNTTACPLPPVCTNCTGQGKKCINGVCQTGYKIYTSSVYDPLLRKYFCTYHYQWSDGSTSGDYSEISNTPCAVAE